MRKNLKKLALPAIAAAGAVMGAYSAASADIIVNLTETSTNSGGFDVYVLSVLNNGANSTGTVVNAVNMKLNLTSAGFIHMDNTKDIDGDSVSDVNLLGASDAYGSTIGTFAKGFGLTVSGAGDFENHIGDTTSTFSSYSNYLHGQPQVYNTIYNSLTSLEIDLTLNINGGGSAATVAKNFANIVVPTGATFTVAGGVGAPSQQPTNYLITVGPGVTTTSSGPIVLLLASTPTNTGGKINGGGSTGTYTPNSPANTLTVTPTGGAGSYLPGYVKGLSPAATAGYTPTSGFAGGDLEIYLLNIKTGGSDPSSADETKLAADITADNAGVTASLVSDPNLTNLGGIAWDIELKFAAPAGANGNFGFNFSGETSLAGGAVTVTDIAAIPEPATAGLLMVGGLGLLARRRRSSAK